jgi:co-chaperonin GroES (HSP10)
MASSKNNSNRGEVVALGTDVKEFFNLGDKVIFSQGVGVNYTNGTDDYKIINTRDVLCKVIEE